MANEPLRVQFVCLGNICRSPAAQGVMEAVLQDRKLSDRILVDSAGTADYHIGKQPDSRMIAAAAKRGIVLSSRAKQFRESFFDERTLILAMDHDNYQNIVELCHHPAPSNVRLFSDFLDASWPRSVPDPYYGGDEGFEYVLDMLQAGCPAVADYLEESAT